MYEEHQHGNPIHKPKPSSPPKPISPLILSLMVLVPFMAFVPFFAVVDYYIEGSVVHVNGTVTDQWYPYSGMISNSSDPISWIEVDGKRYVAREVDFDRFGDTGASLEGEYKKGDHLEMNLFPYRPYSTWNDTPAFWALLIMVPLFIEQFILMKFKFR